MAHGAISGRNGNMPAGMRVGLAENHFLYGGLLRRSHGNSFSRIAWRDSRGEAHPFARFIANYKNCRPWSQTVKTEVTIQWDSSHGGKSQPQPSKALPCPDPIQTALTNCAWCRRAGDSRAGMPGDRGTW